MKTKNTHFHLVSLILAALFAAMICVSIQFIHIPIGGQGYFNIGDAFIYLSAALLPAPYACMSAAVGGALGDILAGGPAWIPFTVIIKILVALTFTSKKETFLNRRNLIALFTAWPITCGGYYLAEALLYDNWAAPAAGIVGNTIQVIASGVLFVVLASVFDKMQLKKRMGRM